MAQVPDDDAREMARCLRSEAKRKLARELHDTVAQHLTLMVVQMEHFKLDLAGQQTAVSRIDRMQESAREVLRRLRQVLCQLREEPAMDAGFVADVRTLLDLLQRGSGVRARLRVSAAWPPTLTRATTHHLRWIVAEALDHVVPNSAAVEVGLEAGRGLIIMTVSGDGATPAGGDRRRAQSLVNMRQRATVLGGRLRVTRNVGSRGTTVRVVVGRPVGEEALQRRRVELAATAPQHLPRTRAADAGRPDMERATGAAPGAVAPVVAAPFMRPSRSGRRRRGT